MVRARRSPWLSLVLAVCAACPSTRERGAAAADPCSLDPREVRASGMPRNVILLIGDGMGAEHVRAARMFAGGDERAPLAFDELPVRGSLATLNAEGTVTDSAAAATAMATGRKVDNQVVSVALPGDGGDLVTSLELHARRGKRTGLVTTGTPLTDATPAAFGAHARDRHLDDEVARDYLEGSRPSLLVGPRLGALTAGAARAAGYTVVDDEVSLRRLAAGDDAHAALLFDPRAPPPLGRLTSAALELLGDDDEGFFLVVEQDGIDSAGHANDLEGVIEGVLELAGAVEVARAFAAARDDTLVVVTADHETGGLAVVDSAPTAGDVPGHTWSGGTHTAADVPLFALGPGSALLEGHQDNTCVFQVTTGLSSSDER